MLDSVPAISKHRSPSIPGTKITPLVSHLCSKLKRSSRIIQLFKMVSCPKKEGGGQPPLLQDTGQTVQANKHGTEYIRQTWLTAAAQPDRTKLHQSTASVTRREGRSTIANADMG